MVCDQTSKVTVIIKDSHNIFNENHKKVLAPTSQTTNREEFCADDSHSGGGSSFDDAIAEVNLLVMAMVVMVMMTMMMMTMTMVMMTMMVMMVPKVGEGPNWPGTSYESWGEIPQVGLR